MNKKMCIGICILLSATMVLGYSWSTTSWFQRYNWNTRISSGGGSIVQTNPQPVSTTTTTSSPTTTTTTTTVPLVQDDGECQPISGQYHNLGCEFFTNKHDCVYKGEELCGWVYDPVEVKSCKPVLPEYEGLGCETFTRLDHCNDLGEGLCEWR